MNPALVYGRMTGWGQTGPRARQAGHDLNYLALTGALFLAGDASAPPATPATMLGDIGGGALYLVAGMLAGLIQAQRSGTGCTVDAAIVDGASHMMALLASMGDQFARDARGQSLLDGPHWSRCYRCADGRDVSVQCLEPKFYALFLDQMGLGKDPLFADQFDRSQWPAQSAALARCFAQRPQAHWAALFAQSDACVAPVLSPAEALRDPHMVSRGVWQGEAPAPAPRFDALARRMPAVSTRGADADDILKDLQERGLL